MSTQEENNTTCSQNKNSNNKDDQHEHDMVMPGFRFHPTEEELVEFYLRRKVEGKRFNVELITFLDLYRYDPWELPALAAIGEKEWFFYVPRDRKYRNGDRPNRVTTSGYWKATGADRMIRTENFRSIGLKKTLVFYSGKAPKGIRTSWIMNEYRLPHHETEKSQKAEISLCRVYKRAGVEGHSPYHLPRSLPSSSNPSSSRGGTDKRSSQSATNRAQPMEQQMMDIEKMAEAPGVGGGMPSSRVINQVGMGLGISSKPNNPSSSSYGAMTPLLEDHNHQNHTMMMNFHHHHHHPKQHFPTSSSLSHMNFMVSPPAPNNASTTSHHVPMNAVVAVDDLHRLVNFQQHEASFQQNSLQSLMLPPTTNAFSTDKLWDWNPLNEETSSSRDYNPSTTPFK
ncbi:NAC domain [Dillenia turbinata]|uniref:NAC domain n=1 Tax=Dillenia turbinata TaxID=194707 RepID=A0AAN8ZSV6_9MAGN